MPSAVTTVLLMGALMVASAFAQSYDSQGVRAMCADVELEECGDEPCGFYRLNEFSCVKVLTLERDFENAQMGCELINGNLVKVQTEEEHKKLLCMMIRVFPRRIHYWIGAVRREDGYFYWFDGSGPVEFAPWREGQPDNYEGEEDCVWMNSGTWGAWNDGACYEASSVACQVLV
ncbi:C-type isolectin Sp-CL4-like [Dunckerocampus dactyliophorus]|uniref:C-type isolectin Sp-CL4-like n=1 Tax=Dunckerocampus dactyliophorus TaxID=161453 RepID=UPI0024070793|nr:C-type isolectin Sp-CL4-like [Dunckerocampus dactyliophorus]